MSSKFPFSQPCFKFQPSFLLPQPLATLMSSHVTVSHSRRLTNFLWPGTIWTGTTYYLLHDVILSPVSGGFPKKYICRGPPSLLSQNRHGWLLPPLPAYSSQFCSQGPFVNVSPPKSDIADHSKPLRVVELPLGPAPHRMRTFLRAVCYHPPTQSGGRSAFIVGGLQHLWINQTFRAGIALRD